MLKWLHTIIGNAKAFISGTFHGLGKKHMQTYCTCNLFPWLFATSSSIFLPQLYLNAILICKR
jgi:hypothetical protein